LLFFVAVLTFLFFGFVITRLENRFFSFCCMSSCTVAGCVAVEFAA
jgi:hypothetical protein